MAKKYNSGDHSPASKGSSPGSSSLDLGKALRGGRGKEIACDEDYAEQKPMKKSSQLSLKEYDGDESAEPLDFDRPDANFDQFQQLAQITGKIDEGFDKGDYSAQPTVNFADLTALQRKQLEEDAKRFDREAKKGYYDEMREPVKSKRIIKGDSSEKEESSPANKEKELERRSSLSRQSIRPKDDRPEPIHSLQNPHDAFITAPIVADMGMASPNVHLPTSPVNPTIVTTMQSMPVQSASGSMAPHVPVVGPHYSPQHSQFQYPSYQYPTYMVPTNPSYYSTGIPSIPTTQPASHTSSAPPSATPTHLTSTVSSGIHTTHQPQQGTHGTGSHQQGQFSRGRNHQGKHKNRRGDLQHSGYPQERRDKRHYHPIGSGGSSGVPIIDRKKAGSATIIKRTKKEGSKFVVTQKATPIIVKKDVGAVKTSTDDSTIITTDKSVVSVGSTLVSTTTSLPTGSQHDVTTGVSEKHAYTHPVQDYSGAISTPQQRQDTAASSPAVSSAVDVISPSKTTSAAAPSTSGIHISRPVKQKSHIQIQPHIQHQLRSGHKEELEIVSTLNPSRRKFDPFFGRRGSSGSESESRRRRSIGSLNLETSRVIAPHDLAHRFKDFQAKRRDSQRRFSFSTSDSLPLLTSSASATGPLGLSSLADGSGLLRVRSNSVSGLPRSHPEMSESSEGESMSISALHPGLGLTSSKLSTNTFTLDGKNIEDKGVEELNEEEEQGDDEDQEGVVVKHVEIISVASAKAKKEEEQEEEEEQKERTEDGDQSEDKKKKRRRKKKKKEGSEGLDGSGEKKKRKKRRKKKKEGEEEGSDDKEP
ncbi:hypothetical protein ADUPG1_010252 [Aduncisulcus paluster]|uniref:Uncharacterized protein n=1 Tax=Aduncisulcus paluster TaxID=2918883 RepID=A0ABQ5JQI4_9EUKA|nr:hypothetical protein ADUPG1_010252 [Aduncisulcus paluster]